MFNYLTIWHAEYDDSSNEIVMEFYDGRNYRGCNKIILTIENTAPDKILFKKSNYFESSWINFEQITPEKESDLRLPFRWLLDKNSEINQFKVKEDENELIFEFYKEERKLALHFPNVKYEQIRWLKSWVMNEIHKMDDGNVSNSNELLNLFDWISYSK